MADDPLRMSVRAAWQAAARCDRQRAKRHRAATKTQPQPSSPLPEPVKCVDVTENEGEVTILDSEVIIPDTGAATVFLKDDVGALVANTLRATDFTTKTAARTLSALDDKLISADLTNTAKKVAYISQMLRENVLPLEALPRSALYRAALSVVADDEDVRVVRRLNIHALCDILRATTQHSVM